MDRYGPTSPAFALRYHSAVRVPHYAGLDRCQPRDTEATMTRRGALGPDLNSGRQAALDGELPIARQALR
jgi:hypothetical protein